MSSPKPSPDELMNLAIADAEEHLAQCANLQTSDLKPLYPDFPVAVLPIAPSLPDPNDIHLNSMGGCYCPSCVPTLYNAQAPHLGAFDISFESIPSNGKACGSCSVPQILDMFNRHVDRIAKGQLTSGEQSALQNLEVFLKGVESCIHIEYDVQHPEKRPILPEIEEYLNVLCFGGNLRNLKYSWKDQAIEGMPENYLGFYYNGENTVHLNSHIYWGYRGQETTPWPAQKRVQHILGTLIHEMLHAYFDRYLCDGLCIGTPAQRQLCLHLTARMYHMYVHVYVRPQDKIVMYKSLCGHGPAFVYAARKLARVMENLLGYDTPLNVGHTHFSYPAARGSTCLSHGYINEDEQMSRALDSLRDGSAFVYSCLNQEFLAITREELNKAPYFRAHPGTSGGPGI